MTNPTTAVNSVSTLGKVSETLSSAGSWLGRQISAGVQQGSALVKYIWDSVHPYLAQTSGFATKQITNLGELISTNPGTAGVLAVIIATAGYFMCCRGQTQLA